MSKHIFIFTNIVLLQSVQTGNEVIGIARILCLAPSCRPLGASTTHMRSSRPLMRSKHCKLSARPVTSPECGSQEAQSTRFAGEPPRRVFRDQNYARTGRSRHPCQRARHQGRCTQDQPLKIPADSRGITFCQEYVQRMVSRIGHRNMFNEWGWQYVFVDIKYVQFMSKICYMKSKICL